MTATDWLALLLACAAGAMSPGPSLALVVRHASASLPAGIACSVAHAGGVGVYAALAVSGLALAFERQAWLAQIIALLAGAWLLRLAWLSWRSPGDWSGPNAPLGPALRDGLLMGLVNPKVALFFLAIFTAVLPAGASVLEQVAAVGLAIGIDAGWYVLVSLLLYRSGLLGFLQSHAKALNRASALIFAALAVYLWWGLMR